MNNNSRRTTYTAPSQINPDEVEVDMTQVATCPFDRSHVMKKCRLQYHIVECMKRYKGTKVPCPYDHTEYFEPENLIWHLSECPSRKCVEVQQFNSERNRKAAVKEKRAPIHQAPIQPDNRYSDESW